MNELFEWALRAGKLPLWARYLSTTLLVVVALLLRLAFGEQLPGYAFILFYPTIVICGFLFGGGSGFLATILSAILAAVFLLRPQDSVFVKHGWDAVVLAMFVVGGSLAALLTEALHWAYANASNEHAEKELLLRELAHRTRNDFGAVAAMLRVQAQGAQEPVNRALTAAAERVGMLARVHHRLSLMGERVVVDSREFLGELCREMRSVVSGLGPVALECRLERHNIGQQKAVVLSLIINEMITNALKHAFPEGRRGVVSVSFERDREEYRLIIADDGVGMRQSEGGAGMGHRLCRTLAAQVGGRFTVEHSAPGTKIIVTVPVARTEQPEPQDRRETPALDQPFRAENPTQRTQPLLG